MITVVIVVVVIIIIKNNISSRDSGIPRLMMSFIQRLQVTIGWLPSNIVQTGCQDVSDFRLSTWALSNQAKLKQWAVTAVINRLISNSGYGWVG